MASESALAEVKRIIESFYQFAAITFPDNLSVNERVAEVFGIMLDETRKCSKAFGWIPTPPGGKASIFWLVSQFGKGLFNHYKSQLSLTCARGVIGKWHTELTLASMGLAVRRLPTWA
jgi:hypothetical protein